MKPSGVITNPDPLPATSRGRFLTRCSISMFTTAGATRATALTTEREYSSSNKSSVETSLLLVNPEPFCGRGSPNRLIAVGSSCSDTAKSFVINSTKKIDQANLSSTTVLLLPYRLLGLLLSSCALPGDRLRKVMPKSSLGGSVMDAQCPSRLVLDRIADKWTALIIQVLANGTKRYAALQREIGRISQKMLTQTLRSLERDGLVQRKVDPVVPPKVEYSLTRLGRTLIEPLHALCRWSEKHLAELQANRARAKANVQN